MDDLYVVGIGSSAGGLRALFEFFENLNEEPEAAIVIVPHLERSHESFLPYILSKKTFLKTKTIENGERLLPNVVYVLPENTKVFMKEGFLFLKGRPFNEKINKAIDDFFISMAEDLKERAVGVVLSGLGSDGTLGAIQIKAHGGMVMVQEPMTAQFHTMPSNTISKDHPDFILPPGKMPEQLIKHVKSGVLNRKA